MSNPPTSAYAARASGRVRRVCQTTQTSSQQCVPRLQSVTQRSLNYALIIVTLAVALGCRAQARESDYPSVNDEGREQAAQLLVERAKRSFNAGDYQAAVNSYSRLLRLKPRDDRVYFNRGLARHKNGDVSGALLGLGFRERIFQHLLRAGMQLGDGATQLGDGRVVR